MKKCKDKCVYYTKEDFTNEEIERKNVIAEYVLKDNILICKYCGNVGMRKDKKE